MEGQTHVQSIPRAAVLVGREPRGSLPISNAFDAASCVSLSFAGGHGTKAQCCAQLFINNTDEGRDHAASPPTGQGWVLPLLPVSTQESQLRGRLLGEGGAPRPRV